METPSSATPASAVDKTILTDLAASRAEVEALKRQVSQLVAQHESQAKQIAEAVHAQVTLALANQSANAATTPTQSITQDQFSTFLQMQETKFDAMTSIFREMMHSQQNSLGTGNNDPTLTTLPIDPPNEHGTIANKRTGTEDLEHVHGEEESMDIDSEPQSKSRKRNNQSASPEKQSAQLFPLFRLDGRNKEVI